MTYTFVCPSPCSRVIRIDASNADDAVREIIKAGGMACRNEENLDVCKEGHLQLSPLPQRQLRDIIRFMMNEENEEKGSGVTTAQQNDHRAVTGRL